MCVFYSQRKETLLVEYKEKGKANKFVDKRIGENDPEMSLEDKMLKRFAMEKQVCTLDFLIHLIHLCGVVVE